MKTNRTKVIGFTIALLVGVCCAWPAMAADDDAAALAKAAQNPVASLISVPIQLNMNFGTGPEDDLQTVTNIQPVVPFSLGEKLESDYPDHPAGHLPARLRRLLGTGERHRRHPVLHFLVSKGANERWMDLGCRRYRPTRHRNRQPARPRGLGAGADGSGAANVRSLGVWRFGEQRLVGLGGRRSRQSESVSRPAVHQLQLPLEPGPLPDFFTDNHRQLGGGEWTGVVGPPRPWYRPDHTLRHAAGESAGRVLLQRRAAGRRPGLSGEIASSIHVSKVTERSSAWCVGFTANNREYLQLKELWQTAVYN